MGPHAEACLWEPPASVLGKKMCCRLLAHLSYLNKALVAASEPGNEVSNQFPQKSAYSFIRIRSQAAGSRNEIALKPAAPCLEMQVCDRKIVAHILHHLCLFRWLLDGQPSTLPVAISL